MQAPIEISVVSGKGGTGKTILTSSLAFLLGEKVIADCDVDAPDLHLLLKPAIKERHSFMGMSKARIKPELCSGCGRCREVCRFDAVIQEDGRLYEIDTLLCEGCSVCQWFCPEQAIEMVEVEAGEWYISETRVGSFVHARLSPAQENSGKLVTIVRREARKLAIEKGLKMVLIDGPPGIGCPVIASITGAKLAMLVVEPTESGIHDLQRIYSLAKHFDIACCAVINRFDLNMEMSWRIEEFLLEQNIPLWGKIPFSYQVNEAISRGRIIVEDAPQDPVSGVIRKIAASLREFVISNYADAGASKHSEDRPQG